LKNVANFGTRAFFNGLIQIYETSLQASSQLSTHGALTHGHKTDERYVLTERL
jgi:hypothetical protein